MRNRRFAAAGAGAVAVIAVGLSGTATAAPPLVPQGKINSIVLSQDEVSNIIGATMSNELTYPQPLRPADFGDKSACSVLYGLASNSVGDDYDAFKSAIQKDGDDSDFNHIVEQNVAIYGEVNLPAKLFHDAFGSLTGCTGPIHVSFSDGGEEWQFKAPTVTGYRAQWVAAELSDGNPTGWRCAHDVRVQSNVMLEAEVCQFGNPTRITSQLADRMVAAAS